MTDESPVPAPAAEAPVKLDPAACAAELKARFPALFGGQPKPIKLRIHADIQARAPGVFSKTALSAFFRRYTGSHGYLIALTKATQRFDLDGQPAGELADEHRQAAADELKRRRELRQAREAEAMAGQQERAALLRAFETTTLTPTNFCALKGLTPEVLDAQLALARQERTAAPPPMVRPRHDDRPGPRPESRPRGSPRDRQPQKRPVPRAR